MTSPFYHRESQRPPFRARGWSGAGLLLQRIRTSLPSQPGVSAPKALSELLQTCSGPGEAHGPGSISSLVSPPLAFATLSQLCALPKAIDLSLLIQGDGVPTSPKSGPWLEAPTLSLWSRIGHHEGFPTHDSGVPQKSLVPRPLTPPALAPGSRQGPCFRGRTEREHGCCCVPLWASGACGLAMGDQGL